MITILQCNVQKQRQSMFLPKKDFIDILWQQLITPDKLNHLLEGTLVPQIDRCFLATWAVVGYALFFSKMAYGIAIIPSLVKPNPISTIVRHNIQLSKLCLHLLEVLQDQIGNLYSQLAFLKFQWGHHKFLLLHVDPYSHSWLDLKASFMPSELHCFLYMPLKQTVACINKISFIARFITLARYRSI